MARPIVFIASLILLPALVAGEVHPAATSFKEYELKVSFDIPRSKITGVSRTGAVKGERLLFHTGPLAIKKVVIDRKPAAFQVRDGSLAITPAESGDLEIHYEGVFKPADKRSLSRSADIPNVIGGDGISLTSTWYPRDPGAAKFRLNADLPKGFTAVSEAETIRRIETRAGVSFRFEFEHPVGGITFVATDRYRILVDSYRGIELAAYFFREDQALARRYLDFAKEYIRLYEGLLTRFPFKRFAIVENFLPTGYSMPTYTLLGQAVVRLPFIAETSLGHEILHQWFGNHVYNGENGNWSEGLTTYLADHLYEEQKNEGESYRKRILIDYANYVRDKNVFPLREFNRRFDQASRAIGYGKAAMVFHMLRRMLGDDDFFGALKRILAAKQFQLATWDDLRVAFQAQSGRELGWYFEQWLDRRGLPELEMRGFAVERSNGALALNFDLSQRGEVYRLEVPVTVVYRSGDEKNLLVPLAERNKGVRVELDSDPAEIIIDKNFDLARKLSEPEIPPVVAGLMGAENLMVVPPVDGDGRYGAVIDSFRTRGAIVTDGGTLSDRELRSATLLVLGADHPILDRLYSKGKVEIVGRGFDLVMLKHPWNPAGFVGIIAARSAREVAAALPKIFHYGRYSALAFDNGRNVSATVAASRSGVRKSLSKDPPAVEPATLQSLSAVIEKLADKKIIYVGEEHDRYAHHQVQLEVLRGLHRQNPKIAVGMEMFQRPAQKALDDYIGGKIDERAFLKQSEYFKRWNLDFHHYKPILDFAREKRLPVIALNLPSEITGKVGKGGIDSLSEEERRELPGELDFSDPEYRARLKDVFAAHPGYEEKNFEFFHQAQILWDETMAESIDRFLKQRPDYRVLVVAGAGHLQYDAGIPKRSHRRNGLDYATILSDGEVSKGIADFIVFPEALNGPAAPLLMAWLAEGGQSVRIARFAKDSVAEKAGLKVDDILLSLDGGPVAGVDDVRIALFYKRAGEIVKVRARRGGDELEFSVKLR